LSFYKRSKKKELVKSINSFVFFKRRPDMKYKGLIFAILLSSSFVMLKSEVVTIGTAPPPGQGQLPPLTKLGQMTSFISESIMTPEEALDKARSVVKGFRKMAASNSLILQKYHSQAKLVLNVLKAYIPILRLKSSSDILKQNLIMLQNASASGVRITLNYIKNILLKMQASKDPVVKRFLLRSGLNSLIAPPAIAPPAIASPAYTYTANKNFTIGKTKYKKDVVIPNVIAQKLTKKHYTVSMSCGTFSPTYIPMECGDNKITKDAYIVHVPPTGIMGGSTTYYFAKGYSKLSGNNIYGKPIPKPVAYHQPVDTSKPASLGASESVVVPQ